LATDFECFAAQLELPHGLNLLPKARCRWAAPWPSNFTHSRHPAQRSVSDCSCRIS